MVIGLATQIKDGIKQLLTENDALKRRIAELQAKVDKLTAERDQMQSAIDAMGNGQFYAMYRKVCEERDALRERLEAITAALRDNPGT